MTDKLNIKIIFLDVEPSNSIAEWKNLWETYNNTPCGITDDGLYYVIVDYMVLPKIANLASYETRIFPAIKDFCIRDVPPTTDCSKMEIYCDDHGRFYADIDKEKPLVLLSLGWRNLHADCLDLDREIVNSLQKYAYADAFMEVNKCYCIDWYILLFYSVNNVSVIDILYKIFSLKISGFNAISNSSLSIEKFAISTNNMEIYNIVDNNIQDEDSLKHVLTFYSPNTNI